MSTFEAIREVTSYKRPPGTHGCKLTELIPGLYTAHFEEFQSPTFFQECTDINPPIGLIVNSAIARDQCPVVTGYYGPSIEVVCIHLFDDPTPGNAKVFFPSVNKAVKETIDSGKSALIHCYGSISRSAVFIIAYLMEFNGLSALEATKFLKAKWDATWPNDSFVRQLLEFEQELESKRSRWSHK